MILGLLLSIASLYSQTDPPITIRYDSLPLRDALIELEERTQKKFYFDEAWLENIYINKRYNDQDLEIILDDLLEETDINYFIQDNRIILLNNNVIQPNLPAAFFEAPETGTDAPSGQAPIFQEEYLSLETGERNLITVGKTDPSSTAQVFQVSGQVTNASTGDPIEDLVIFNADRTLYAVTDSTGFFQIDLPAGHHILETELLGYEKIEQPILVYGDGAFDLSIPEEIELLDEIVVRSNRDANVRDAVVGVSTIDVEGIKNIPLVLGERDILRVATTLPGITKAGEGADGLNVRGGRTDQNLVLLDDAVLYNPSHFFGLFSAVNPFTTQSLEIYKASIPAKFGGRLSSVFDIETKAGDKNEFAGEGSIGPVTGNLVIETPIVKGKSSLIAGVRATYADYILRMLDESSLKNSQANFYDGILKYSHDINEDNLVEATLYYSKDNFSLSTDSLFGFSNRLVSLKWNRSLKQGKWFSIIGTNSQYQYDLRFDANANNDFLFNYTLNESLAKMSVEHNVLGGHKLNYGLSTKLYVTDPGTIQPLGPESDVDFNAVDREKGLESALYFSDLYEINERWLVDLGLRYSFYASLGEASQNIYRPGVPRNESAILEVRNYDNNQVIKTYGGLEYRISARYLLGSDWSLKAGINRTMQYIHLLTTNTTQSPTDIWKLSDLNIKPQRAQQFSLGIFKNVVSKNLELSLEGYYKKMKDLLDYKIGAQLILNDALETELLQGSGKAYGGELLIKKTSGRLNGHLGYSYSRAFIKLASTLREEQVNNGNFFPANFDRPHDFSLIANYSFTKRFSASLNFVYQTGRPVTYPVGKFFFADQEHVLYSDRNQFRIPDYYRLDFGVNIEGSHKKQKLAHSFVNISVYNLLGRNNPYSVFFVNDGGRIKAYKTSIFAIPIPTITYNFKF